MKNILLLIFLTASLGVTGQINNQHSTTPPAYFLDSVRVPLLPLFDPYKIENINIQKGVEEAGKTYGRVYITSKNPRDFNFLTLQEIAKQNTKSEGPYLFMINDEITKEIENVKIDSSYILKCELLSTKDIAHLMNLPEMIIINIKTKTKANLDKENARYIRGDGRSVTERWTIN